MRRKKKDLQGTVFMYGREQKEKYLCTFMKENLFS